MVLNLTTQHRLERSTNPLMEPRSLHRLDPGVERISDEDMCKPIALGFLLDLEDHPCPDRLVDAVHEVPAIDSGMLKD